MKKKPNTRILWLKCRGARSDHMLEKRIEVSASKDAGKKFLPFSQRNGLLSEQPAFFQFCFWVSIYTQRCGSFENGDLSVCKLT